MVTELVGRLDAAASELLACLKRGEASSEEMLCVLSVTRAVRGKLDTAQALAAAGVAGSRNHGDGGAHGLAESTGVSRAEGVPLWKGRRAGIEPDVEQMLADLEEDRRWS